MVMKQNLYILFAVLHFFKLAMGETGSSTYYSCESGQESFGSNLEQKDKQCSIKDENNNDDGAIKNDDGAIKNDDSAIKNVIKVNGDSKNNESYYSILEKKIKTSYIGKKIKTAVDYTSCVASESFNSVKEGCSKLENAWNFVFFVKDKLNETFDNFFSLKKKFLVVFDKSTEKTERFTKEKQNVYTKKKNPNSTISSYKEFFQTFNDNKPEAIPEYETKKTNDVIKFEETQDENSLFEKFMSFNLKVYKFTEFLGQNYIFASLVAYYLIKRILFVKYLSFSQWFVFFSSLYFHIVSTRLFPISLFV